METQNVSAQLYFKQLPEDRDAASYNCQDTYPNLSTCVDNTSTDAQIETAFQKQLNLSEYYKSPEVFDTMKREFTDQTMDAQNTPVSTAQPQPKPPAVPTVIPVGPTDFLNKFIKESFGMSGGSRAIIIVSCVLVAILLLYIFFKPELDKILKWN